MPGQQPRSQNDDTSPYMPYGASGGGGADGNYVFTELAEIDGIIADLQGVLADLEEDNSYFDQAIRLATPPAEDAMSRGQADAYRASLREGWDHNKAVAAYAEDQVTKLQAAHQTYVDKDSGAADRLRGIDEADQ